jgi:nitrogen fixation protein NifX
MIKSERKLHVEPSPGEAEFSLKVAFTTLDRHHVDQHFGTAKCVLVYGVNKEHWSLLEAIEYPSINEGTHEKLPARIADLDGCAAIYCNACGASAIRQLLGKEINPVKVSEGANIHTLLSEIQDELQGTPTGWLSRALKTEERKKQDNASVQGRLSKLMDEEW